MGGVAETESKSTAFGVAVAPSVIDQDPGSRCTCLYACSCMYAGCREVKKKKIESFCPQGLSWACAGSYIKTANEECSLLWPKGLIVTSLHKHSRVIKV